MRQRTYRLEAHVIDRRGRERDSGTQDEAGAFRVIYPAKLVDAVYVLHCFQKKTQQTSEKDIKLARKRFKDLMREQP